MYIKKIDNKNKKIIVSIPFGINLIDDNGTKKLFYSL